MRKPSDAGGAVGHEAVAGGHISSGDEEQEMARVMPLERVQPSKPEDGAGTAQGPVAEEAIADALDQGDRRGALVLCARHYGPVIGRLCMAMVGSQADAEDLTQETLLDAHDGFDGWRREGSMRAWLLTIARRKCARHIEKKARRSARLRLVHDAAAEPTASSAEREILLRQRAERARAAIDTIRPSEREALLLRYVAGLSFQEVGLACGVDDVAARKRVSRAIAHLRETLREEGQDR